MKKYITFVPAVACVILIIVGLTYVYKTNNKIEVVGQSASTSTVVATSTEQKEVVLATNIVDVLPATDVLGGVTTYINVTGKVKSATLFAYSTVGGESFTSNDNTFISIGNGKVEQGGHFNGNVLVLQDANLFKLGAIDTTNTNLLDIINAGSTMRVDLFVSSARGNREIKSAFIRYTCDGECSLTQK